MRLKLRKAFSIPKRRLRPEELKLLRLCAGRVRKSGLQLPLSLLLDGSRPLHFLGASACRLFQPLLEAGALPRGSVERFARLLENPAAADEFLELLSSRRR